MTFTVGPHSVYREADLFEKGPGGLPFSLPPPPPPFPGLREHGIHSLNSSLSSVLAHLPPMEPWAHRCLITSILTLVFEMWPTPF